MAIPKHDEIRIPALQLLQKEGTLKLRDFQKPLAQYFKLSDKELVEEYESGNGYVFYDRISWALSYMNMAGLLDKPKRGTYQINEKGMELLRSPEAIDKYISDQLDRRKSKIGKTLGHVSENLMLDSKAKSTPQEKLYSAFSKIRDSVYQEIITTILSKTPLEFEKLVVLLLQKMGYGGEVEDAGVVTQYVNDGGIDGIIKEDILGLGRIYIQAKRYQMDASIGRQEIQKFVGALAVVQSNKGVFITTSRFTKSAIEYANSLNGITNLVLIDGEKLAEYIYDYNLGMQTEQVIEIKKLDVDFWDSMMDA